MARRYDYLLTFPKPRVQQQQKITHLSHLQTELILIQIMDEQNHEQFLDQVDDTLPRTLQHKTSQFEQLHLKYSYSGISNSSSSNDFILTTTRSFHQDWGKLNFVQADKLFQTLTLKAAELEKRMLISQELILHMLYVYKWNEERLMDVYYEKHVDEYQGLNRVISEGGREMQDESGEGDMKKDTVCGVCFTQGQLVVPATYCGHSYCIDCWQGYIKQNLTQSKIFFPACMSTTCPPHPILLQFVKNISLQLAELYRKKICVNYAIINTSVSYCPSDSCPLFCEKNTMIQQTTVQCPCGMFYCFRCQKQSHQPALCAQVQKWDKLANQQQSNEEWLRKYTRKCPTCKQDVEKYVGCNLVKCICGQEFCFSCRQKWDEVHKAEPEKCNRERLQGTQGNENIEKQEKQSNTLERLVDKVIYLSRCMNNDMRLVKKTQQLLTKQQPLYYLKDLFQDLKSRIHHSWTSLKWSTITLFLRQKLTIQEQIQKDTLQSIHNLLQTVQKIYTKVQSYSTLSHMLYMDSKELMYLKEELFKRKEIMVKTVEVWDEVVKERIGGEY